MSTSKRRANGVQILFLVLGLFCLLMALWVAVTKHATSEWSLMGSQEGRETVLWFFGGASAFFFALATIIHLKS